MEYYEDLDWESVITPIKIDKYVWYLNRTRYDTTKTKELVTGFTNGFDLGYRGPVNWQEKSCNIPFKIGSKVEMWNKLINEVKLGRHAGPFRHKPPFKYFVQSLIGLVPKSNGKTRLIFHLSFDFDQGKDVNRHSVNYYTPREDCKVQYRDLDFAVCTILDLVGKSASNKTKRLIADQDPSEVAQITQQVAEDIVPSIFMAKSDLMSAFRILPILPEQRFLLTMCMEDPLSGEPVYFVDKNLPFGSSINCRRFQSFSDSLQYIVEAVTGHYF